MVPAEIEAMKDAPLAYPIASATSLARAPDALMRFHASRGFHRMVGPHRGPEPLFSSRRERAVGDGRHDPRVDEPRNATSSSSERGEGAGTGIAAVVREVHQPPPEHPGQLIDGVVQLTAFGRAEPLPVLS
jgi:hypothetical protein